MSEAARGLIDPQSWPPAPPGSSPAPASTIAGTLPPLRFAPAAAEPGAKLRELLRAFLRHTRLMVVTLVALNGIALYAIHSVKPRYTAEATILIGARQEQVLDLKSVLAGLSGDSEAIESEVQVLKSRQIARSVVEQLHLDTDPDFVPPPHGPGLPERLWDGARTWLNAQAGRLGLPWSLPDPVAAAEPGPRDPVAVASDAFGRHLGIAPRGHSRVVSVTFESGDPALAAAAANQVVNTYIMGQLKAKRDATASAQRWLQDRVAEMRDQVIDADQKVAAYRHKAMITQGRTGTLLSEQLSSLGEQAIEARVARVNAESKLAALQGGAPASQAESLPEVQASPAMQALRAQQSTLEAQVAELSRTLGDGHPRVAAARAAAALVAARINAETGRSVASLQDLVKTARAREAALNHTMDTLRQQVDVGTESEVELHALQHEAEANRALYDRLLTRSRETSVEGGLQQADAQIVSKADTPEQPSFPNPLVIMPIFFVASVIATVLLVFAVEGMDQGFTTLEQVEQVVGAAALGLLPRLRGGARRAFGAGAGPGPLEGSSAFGEAVRSLHTSLMLSGAGRPKVVLVASALPGEGRTTVVLSLARLMASCGKRVVVVDCDLHRPDLHRACGVAAGPGLIDCLNDGTPVYDVLQGDRASPAYVVAAGSKAPTSPDLFASAAMGRVIDALSERFDLVLLDSSPVLAVSETRNLCRLADTTVFTVHWRDTRRNAVLAGLRQILESGGRFAGVLLNDVDLKHYARLSHAGAYQRRIGLYLSE